MAERKPQTFANHARLVAGYHFVLAGIVLVNLGWAVWRLVKDRSADSVGPVLVAVALALFFWYSRIFPLAVQDRLIRLEMRLRLAEVLPPEQRARIPELTVDQLIGLRFASDAELPALVTEVLSGALGNRREIKKRVRDWVPDYCRC